MNMQKMRPWLVAAVIAPLGFYMGQATLAANPASSAGAGLIDKDFEVALHKFVSKRFYNRIGATDEQRSALEGLWKTTSDGTRPLREELRAGVMDMTDLFANDQVSDEQIVAKAHELRAVHEKVMDQRLNAMLKARKVLTKEQKQQIGERIKAAVTGGDGVIRRRLSLRMGISENVE